MEGHTNITEHSVYNSVICTGNSHLRLPQTSLFSDQKFHKSCKGLDYVLPGN